MNNYGALKSLPAQTTIKGQPHQLSYITPQEAGVLKMLGGAGKNVNGVPAYYKQLDDIVTKISTDVTNGGSDNPTFGYGMANETQITKNGNSYGITLADGTKVSASKDLGLVYGRDFGKGVNATTSVANINKALQEQKIEELGGTDNAAVSAYLAQQEEAARLQKIKDDKSDDRQAVFQQENLDRLASTGGKQQGDGFLTDLAGAGQSLLDLGGNIYDDITGDYAKGLGAPDFVTGDTDGDGIMDTYSGGADVRVGDAITDQNFDPKLNPTTAKYYDDYFPAQADKFDADGNIYDDEFFAGSGSFAEEGSVNQSMLDTYGGVEDAGGYFDMFDGNWTVGGIEIPFSEAIVDLLKGSSGDTSVGGGGNGGGGNGGGGNDNDPTFKYTDIFKPNMMNFSMISGGGGGGIWDRFRNSYLTKYGLEGESADIEEIKLSYDPVYGVYYYSDGTLVNPEDLEGLNIGEVFQEEVGKTKSGRQKFDAKTGELIETKLYDQTYSTPEGEEITGNQTFAADGIGSDGSYTSDPRIYDPETGTMVSSTQYNLNLSRQAEADYLASLNQGD